MDDELQEEQKRRRQLEDEARMLEEERKRQMEASFAIQKNSFAHIWDLKIVKVRVVLSQ
jgi:hypothetical protein